MPGAELKRGPFVVCSPLPTFVRRAVTRARYIRNAEHCMLQLAGLTKDTDFSKDTIILQNKCQDVDPVVLERKRLRRTH
jgi:hypothetical protein